MNFRNKKTFVKYDILHRIIQEGSPATIKSRCNLKMFRAGLSVYHNNLRSHYDQVERTERMNKNDEEEDYVFFLLREELRGSSN